MFGSIHTVPRTCYLAVVIYIVGFITLGGAFQNNLSVGAIVMGWGIAEVAVMINTVAVCECSANPLLCVFLPSLMLWVGTQTPTSTTVSRGCRARSRG